MRLPRLAARLEQVPHLEHLPEEHLPEERPPLLVRPVHRVQGPRPEHLPKERLPEERLPRRHAAEPVEA